MILVEVSEDNKNYVGMLVDFFILGCGVFICGENEFYMGFKVWINSEFDFFFLKWFKSYIVNIWCKLNGYLIGI